MRTFRDFLGDNKVLLQVKHILDEDDVETMADWKVRLTEILGKMMFVSGETGEASAETTGIIEEIVRQQVIEMVSHVVMDFCSFVCHLVYLIFSFFSSSNARLKQLVEVQDQSLRMISSFSFVMIKQKYLVSVPFYHGKTCVRT